MSEHYNQLSPSELERLAMLAEEANETSHIIMKIIRHGYSNHNPDTKVKNDLALAKELGDLLGVIRFMMAHGDVDPSLVEAAAADKIQRAKEWMRHFQEPKPQGYSNGKFGTQFGIESWSRVTTQPSSRLLKTGAPKPPSDEDLADSLKDELSKDSTS